jgi:two-component system, sensor histidine kinase and response regulator
MPTILVIEDESLLRAEVAEWLKFEGYTAITAEDGAAGVEKALQYLPDLIVCDIKMPRLDGYDVLLEIRSNIKTADIPFIFLTARAAHEDMRAGMNLGADDYLTKPFTRVDLLQAIKSRLETTAARRLKIREEIEALRTELAREHEQRLIKGKLVGMFSHDFRNPLATILSSISLLRDYADRMDEKRRLAHMNRVDASVRQLLHMLDDMLIITQMESGRLEFKPELLGVEQFFQHIIEEFQIIHAETHTFRIESRFADPMMADPRLLRQIAANLISNAVKYSPAGSEVSITLGFHQGQFAFSVEDRGIGIPEKDQAELFGVFHRGSNVGDVSGTGLGLAIVKQAVELHNGTLHIESEVGRGTKVTVLIPIFVYNGSRPID